jgi:hypothetical protein
MTNFAFDKKAFRDSTKMDLTLLEMVERSQQIKIEKLLCKLPSIPWISRSLKNLPVIIVQRQISLKALPLL